ncbi:MAG TPA: hypothetical protein VGF59_10420, partial [Bryobacteraceae bacterium]
MTLFRPAPILKTHAYRGFWIAFIATAAAFGQSASLTLASGSGTAGGSVSLNLSLSASSQPSGLEWAFSYSPANIVSASVAAGPALTGAGKSLTCMSGTGSIICLGSGMNAATIPNGVVATLTVTLSAAPSGSVPIGIGSLSATLPTGNAESLTGTGAAITVAQSIGVSGVQCNPGTLTSGATSTCTVTLSGAAPSGGSAVALSSNNAALTVPASVTVAASATTATFTATAHTVSSNVTATVTATLNGTSKTASVTVTPSIVVSGVQCNPGTLTSGATSTCTVTLSGAAPSGGAAVSLLSNNAALTVPASLTVAASATTATFTATAHTVSIAQSAIVSGTYNGGSASATISLVTSTTPISSLACNPTSLVSGASATCTVTLGQAAPSGGITVNLSSTNTAVTIPASLAIAAGSKTSTFNAADAGTATSMQTAVLTASLGSSSVTASITVLPLTAGLVAAYSFSEGKGSSTADATGHGHTGQISKASWTAGKYGNALSFNGSNSYVNLLDGTDLQITGSMTLAGWVYSTGNPSDDGQIVARSDGSAGWQLKTSPDTGVRTFGVAVSDGRTH